MIAVTPCRHLVLRRSLDLKDLLTIVMPRLGFSRKQKTPKTMSAVIVNFCIQCRDTVAFGLLLFSLALPSVGLVEALTESASEAECEFPAEDLEESILAAVPQRVAPGTPKKPVSRVRILPAENARRSSVIRVSFSGHRLANGLGAPIRC